MCGIAGIYSFKKTNGREKEALARMQSLLHRRGPDDEGTFISPDNRLCLLHTRLAIIDPRPSGHQPMSNRQATIWVTYNGEIYNYPALRKELIAGGYTFISSSDTEVLLCGYEAWGIEELLRRLRGMFAFAIYDMRQSSPTLLLARDRLGIKPLYYYLDNERLIFSSTVRAIQESALASFEENPDAKIAFLIFGNIPEPMTTVRNVSSLLSGSYLTMHDRNCRPVKYYDLRDKFLYPHSSTTEYPRQEVSNLLDEVVALHLVSDVPVGIFLSGGIDSSCLTALASQKHDEPLRTISIVFDEQGYSEETYQKIVAQRFKTAHHQSKVTSRDYYNEMDRIFEAMDQPTVNGVNTYFVAKVASEAGLKVVLSGAGADEIFCGYDYFKQIGVMSFLRKHPYMLRAYLGLATHVNKKFAKLTYLTQENDLGIYLAMRGIFSSRDIEQLLGVAGDTVERVLHSFFVDNKSSAHDIVQWLSYMETNLYLKNQLLKDTDVMSMYHSVETRVPFLDHVLVEAVASYDSSIKFKKNIFKPLLTQALQGKVPAEILGRRKQGFTFPFALWLAQSGREIFEGAAARVGINRSASESLWRDFKRGAVHWSKVWLVIVLGKQK